MSSTSAAISIVPIVDPHIEESSKHRPLHWLRDPDDLRVVSANREAKQGVAVVAWSKIVVLCTIVTHSLHNVPGGRVRVAELDSAMLMGSVVVFGNGPMTPNSGESVARDRHDRDANRWEMCGGDDRC